MLIDKRVNQSILGCLLNRPTLLGQVDKYSLDITDFADKFEKYIFAAILGLYKHDAKNIRPFDVEEYLSSDKVALKMFQDKNGIEYLQDAISFGETDNFDYYYLKLKKLNLLRDLSKQGFDISQFYCEDLTDDKATDTNSRFETLTIRQITDKIKLDLLKLQNKYDQSDEIEIESIADDLDDFIHGLDHTFEIGPSVQGAIYNQVISGAQKGTLTIRSGSSGLGKTRQAVADACYLAFPVRYNANNRKWDQTGSTEKVLFIVTEQTIKQVKKMVLAYITDMNESRFKYGNFSTEELGIIEKAKMIIEKYADNFIIMKMPNPTIESIKTMIREQCLTKDIGYVFYDYIFIGPALLNEFRGFNLRNDRLFVVYITFPFINGVSNKLMKYL